MHRSRSVVRAPHNLIRKLTRTCNVNFIFQITNRSGTSRFPHLGNHVLRCRSANAYVRGSLLTFNHLSPLYLLWMFHWINQGTSEGLMQWNKVHQIDLRFFGKVLLTDWTLLASAWEAFTQMWLWAEALKLFHAANPQIWYFFMHKIYPSSSAHRCHIYMTS